jgi:hypothetical protein
MDAASQTRGPLAIAIRTLTLVRLVMFVSNFSPDMTQENMSEAPALLGKYEAFSSCVCSFLAFSEQSCFLTGLTKDPGFKCAYFA